MVSIDAFVESVLSKEIVRCAFEMDNDGFPGATAIKYNAIQHAQFCHFLIIAIYSTDLNHKIFGFFVSQIARCKV